MRGSLALWLIALAVGASGCDSTATTAPSEAPTSTATPINVVLAKTATPPTPLAATSTATASRSATSTAPARTPTRGTPGPTRTPAPTRTPTPTATPRAVPLTFYVDGQAGKDANDGSAASPWQTIDQAMNSIAAGDTIIIGGGIYRVTTIRFRPAGAGPDHRTIIKAAPNARVIISGPNDTPPNIYMANFMRLEGLWIGGRWKQAAEPLFNIGGSPIGEGKQFINLTIFGYNGVNEGSSEYYFYQGNRFVHDGLGRFSHPLYLSGGDTPGAMAQHSVVDDNIFVDGEGYAIHGWHTAHDNIITRNFAADHYWGVVMDGSDHVIANNFFWKMNGDPHAEPGWGPWLAGRRTMLINNVLGPRGGALTERGDLASDTIRSNAFLSVSPLGSQSITLMPGDEAAQLGASAAQIDGAIAQLDQAFSQSVEDIYKDQRIEPAFEQLHFHVPTGSPLFQAGSAWFDASQAVNVGPDSPAPATEDGFWSAFTALGFKNFDRYGHSTN